MRFLILYLFVTSSGYAQTITLSGFIKESGSGEILPYTNILIAGSHEGTSANAYGYYAIQVPSNTEIEVMFSRVGYLPAKRQIRSEKDLTLDVDLLPESRELDEVTITGTQDDLSLSQTGRIQLPLTALRQIPTLMGEKDMIKMIQLLPGAQSGTEGSAALYIRGGGPGQNLIILDDAPVYNANHLFGFFSVFNGDAIRNAQYWKGGFPARYGGRVSSVIDLQMKDGNKQKMHGEGGVGLLSSQLTLEGPIKKNTSSYLISTRRTYLDLLTTPFMPADAKFAYRFLDLNLKLNFILNERNRIFISGYFGDDKLRTDDRTVRTQSTIHAETNLGWGNATSSFRWNHTFSKTLFSNITLLFSNFKFSLADKFQRTGTQPNSVHSTFSSGVRDYALKTDFDYAVSNAHNLKFGTMTTRHSYQPRAFRNTDAVSNLDEESIQRYENTETGAYLEDNWQVSERSSLIAGVRLSGLQSSKQSYFFVEPRMSYSFALLPRLHLNASYARTNQFVHLLSNTGIGLATDLWVPATSGAPPEQADIVSIGMSTSWPGPALSLSVDTYRKYLRNIISYKEGATFLDIDNGPHEMQWEDNVTTGNGISYGTELLLKRDKGKVTGWIGYTLSWIVHEFDELNDGAKFHPKYDSRHNISLVCIYQVSGKVMLSATWQYNSGNALTVPQAYYYTNFADGRDLRTTIIDDVYVQEPIDKRIDRVPYFGARNSFRGESYHRLDLAIQLHKKKKRYDRYWEFGLFNAYNRKNPFYYYLEGSNDISGKGQRIQLKKKSLFPVLPFASYNFKF